MVFPVLGPSSHLLASWLHPVSDKIMHFAGLFAEDQVSLQTLASSSSASKSQSFHCLSLPPENLQVPSRHTGLEHIILCPSWHVQDTQKMLLLTPFSEDWLLIFTRLEWWWGQ